MDYSKLLPPELIKEIGDRLNLGDLQMNVRTGIVQDRYLWESETDPEMFIAGDELVDVKWVDNKWIRI